MSMFYEAMLKRTRAAWDRSRRSAADPSIDRHVAPAKRTASGWSPPASGASVVPRPIRTGAVREPATVAPTSRRAPVAEMLRFERVHVDLDRLRTTGLVTLDPGAGRSFESFRRIKRPLLAAAFAEDAPTRNANVVAVSSARTGEGKTYNALNLAVSVTHEKGKSAVLLDADLQRRGLSRWFAVGDHPGVSDYLADPRLLPHQVVVGIHEISKLLFLPAGSRRPDAAELVASARMRVLIESLSALFPDRLIVIDCPPLLEDSSAWEIVRHCGQLVVVVAEGQTRLTDVHEIMSRAGESATLRFVLNKSLRGETEPSYVGS